MRYKMGRVLTACSVVMVLLVSWNMGSVRASSLPHRVFILHSYEAGHVCGQPQHDGVVAALRKAGFKEEENLEIEAYFMDTKRKNNTPELIDEQARLALGKIRDFRPSVLVTLDDNAFRTVALQLVDSDIPVVFSGMNGQPEDYNQKTPWLESRPHPGHNITGVYEKLHIADALKIHSRLLPGVKKVWVFVDPSPTGRAISKQIKLEMEQESVPCSWEMKIATTWEEYQKEIRSANADPEAGAIYPAALLLKDGEGHSYTAPDILAWTVQNSKKPEIALNYAFTRMGLFGGAAVDFHAMGSQAGQMAALVLKGGAPGAIPIEDAQRYALVFNLNRSKELGIQIPADILMAADDIVSAKP
ncbi:MAG: ABC transporter substrate binding protein [Thermodesulfobacteriota bacterium]|nr:ABC transporter substrate binding protein [Thermodesulfobacteriota bacterium]